MLAHAPIIAIVPVRDAAQARRFYVENLGLPVIDDSPFALVVDAAGTMLRLTPVADLHPQPFTIMGWSVDDVGATVATLTGLGVTFTHYRRSPITTE